MSKRVILTCAIVGLMSAAPVFVPFPQEKLTKVAGVPGCGVLVTRTIDSADASPLVVPCPVQVQTTTTPWAAIVMGASVVSVMINAAIVHQTQCRELSLPEAYASMSLPLIGWVFNQQNNQCGHHPHRH